MTVVCEILVFPIQIHKRLLSQRSLKFEGNQNNPIVLQTEMIASSIERYRSFFSALPRSSKHAARNGGINSVCQELSDRFIAELIDAEEKGTIQCPTNDRKTISQDSQAFVCENDARVLFDGEAEGLSKSELVRARTDIIRAISYRAIFVLVHLSFHVLCFVMRS
jgi:hypothetical protein